MKYYSFSHEDAVKALEIYREYFGTKGIYENKVYPGVKRMLASLKSKGYSLAVASSKPEYYVDIVLKHFDLTKYFDFVGGSDMAETRASKDKVISYCLESIGSPDVKECVMVGDRSHDVIGARTCGLDCIGVLYGFGTKKELLDAGAAALAESVGDIESIIEKM